MLPFFQLCLFPIQIGHLRLVSLFLFDHLLLELLDSRLQEGVSAFGVRTITVEAPADHLLKRYTHLELDNLFAIVFLSSHGQCART